MFAVIEVININLFCDTGILPMTKSKLSQHLRINTKETGFFTEIQGGNAVFSQKTRFLATRA